MIKKLVFAAAAFSMVTLPALAGERAALWNQDARPAQISQHQAVSVADVQDEALRGSDEEAWYPGCLATSVIGGISAVSACGDQWYPACLASGIITAVNGVSSCTE